MSNTIKEQVVNTNLTVLSNLVALGAGAVLEIAGNDVSNQINGQDITLPVIELAVAARLRAALAPQTGV